jgi:hypothetical protein
MKPLSDWYWARDHPDARINLLWQRGYTAQTAEVRASYSRIKGTFDCSDAGMLYYWSTLQTGGDKAPDVNKFKQLFLKYIEESSSGTKVQNNSLNN